MPREHGSLSRPFEGTASAWTRTVPPPSRSRKEATQPSGESDTSSMARSAKQAAAGTALDRRRLSRCCRESRAIPRSSRDDRESSWPLAAAATTMVMMVMRAVMLTVMLARFSMLLIRLLPLLLAVLAALARFQSCIGCSCYLCCSRCCCRWVLVATIQVTLQYSTV